jgi:hypothetical protein
LQQKYQDALRFAHHAGKLDFFITMTANPKWEEVMRELEPGESASST